MERFTAATLPAAGSNSLLDGKMVEYQEADGSISIKFDNGRQWVTVNPRVISPVEIASPSDAVLADRTATYQDSVTGQRLRVNAAGVALEALGGASLTPEQEAEIASIGAKVTTAEQAKTSAEAARDAALAAARIYQTTTAGLAAVASGEYFYTPSAVLGESLILYRDDAGVATEIKRFLSANALGADVLSTSLLKWRDSADTDMLDLDAKGRLAVQDVLFGQARSLAALATDVDSNTSRGAAATGDSSLFLDGVHAALSPVFAGSVDVYNATRDGAPNYRLPVPVRISANEYIVFANAQTSTTDTTQGSIVYRTITVDAAGVITWGAIATLEAGGPDDGSGKAYQYSNVSAIRTNTGRVIAMYYYRNTDAIIHIPYLRYSDDNGATWSARQDLSAFFPQLQVTWRAIVFGPGKMIQMRHGPYAGRIVCACWRSNNTYPSNVSGVYSFFAYSDDNGATWTVGAESHLPRGNESAVVEDWRGDLLLFIRREAKAGKWVARSRDGGATIYETYQLDQEVLNAPVVECGLTQAANDFDLAPPKIIYSSPRPSVAASNTTGSTRDNMTVFASYDGGRTFPYRFQVATGNCQYSAVDTFGVNGFLVLWESGDARQIIKGKIVSIKNILTGA